MNSSPVCLYGHRAAALAIVCMVVLVMVALFHHPVVAQHLDARERFVQLAQAGPADNLVHGTLIAMLAVLAGAMTTFNAAFEQRRFALSGALAAYCLGCALLGLAMLFDGFVVPSLAGQFSAAKPQQATAGMPVMAAIGAAIQVFSKAGLIAQCAAMLAWSYAIVTSRQAMPGWRCLAWAGATAGALPALLLLFFDLSLTPHSLMAIFAAHAVWYIAVAFVLYRKGMAVNETPVARRSI